MRALAILLALTAATRVHADAAVRVDGVPVYGRIHDVSPRDIREALKEHGEEPAVRIDVISKSEMHIYYRSRELGWIPSDHKQAAYGSPKLAWSSSWLGITLRPDILNFISTAHEAYIFPVKFTRLSSSAHNSYWLVPKKYGKHLRLLDDAARRDLVRLLSREASWFHGFDDRISIGDEPTNVGFLFRSGRNDLVLFSSSGGRIEGAFNGEHTGGSLEEKQQEQLERWKAKHAQPEVAAK